MPILDKVSIFALGNSSAQLLKHFIMVTIKLSDEEFRLLKRCMSSYHSRLERFVFSYPDCCDKIKDYHDVVRDLYYKLLSIK